MSVLTACATLLNLNKFEVWPDKMEVTATNGELIGNGTHGTWHVAPIPHGRMRASGSSTQRRQTGPVLRPRCQGVRRAWSGQWHFMHVHPDQRARPRTRGERENGNHKDMRDRPHPLPLLLHSCPVCSASSRVQSNFVLEYQHALLRCPTIFLRVFIFVQSNWRAVTWTVITAGRGRGGWVASNGK